MTDRSATATIKGYFYQFDQTIVRLLEASKHASVTVEGIEDIDLDDGADSAFVQCKYYEGTEYNHSVIKEAVIHMLRHFHSRGCPTNQIYRYRLYGHYKSGQHKLAQPLTDEFLKEHFLTYTREKVEYKVHEELKMTAPQLKAFLDLLDIDVNALSYEEQQKNLVNLLVSGIPGCSTTDAEIFYYPNAINVIQSLAVEADEAQRRITRERFLKEVDRKEIIFHSWLKQKFGADYYAKLIRRKYFKFNSTKIPKASRIFVIDMEDEYDVLKAVRMLVSLGDFFSHRELARTPPQDRFCPYVLLRGAAPSEVLELKRSLWNQGVKFSDGYPFQGADFSATLLATDPTKENLWRLKFIPTDDQLAPTIAAITGSVIEIYDLYKTAPLDDALVPRGSAHHAIKCGSSYFIQEVMQA
ncbi:DUF4297 family anti-phage-associated protein [Burkholderia cenocepacia]|uniref:DUF4297 family anti-phage-associated protein n=1 Tax=Burkholderia cenocepacia TaxID=95486 RepID=UPI00264A6FFC|nr:DUF4297 family anti-phage-associated protein [Burkholderia cenocepacia]MDN7683006.1 hypothetical protein [Burkholderia cenocepacia]